MTGKRVYPYRVWCPDLGETREDCLCTYAFSARDAAEHWGAWIDRKNPHDLARKPATVVVETDTGAQYRYQIRAEMSLVFKVTKIPEEE